LLNHRYMIIHISSKVPQDASFGVCHTHVHLDYIEELPRLQDIGILRCFQRAPQKSSIICVTLLRFFIQVEFNMTSHVASKTSGIFAIFCFATAKIHECNAGVQAGLFRGSLGCASQMGHFSQLRPRQTVCPHGKAATFFCSNEAPHSLNSVFSTKAISFLRYLHHCLLKKLQDVMVCSHCNSAV